VTACGGQGAGRRRKTTVKPSPAKQEINVKPENVYTSAGSYKFDRTALFTSRLEWTMKLVGVLTPLSCRKRSAALYQYVAKAMAKIYESLGYCTSAALRTTACHAKPVIGRFEMEQIRRCD
jgi:hypothetical protein